MTTVKQYTIIPIEACKYFISLGYEIIIITNQSGIGRKYFSENDFLKLTKWMIDKFNENGIKILNINTVLNKNY